MQRKNTLLEDKDSRGDFKVSDDRIKDLKKWKRLLESTMTAQ